MRRVSVSFSVPNDVYSNIVKPAKDSNTLGSLISESLRLYQSSSGVRSIVSKGAMRATSDELDSLLDELNSSIGSLDAGIRGMSDDVDAYGETYQKAFNGEDLHEDTESPFTANETTDTPKVGDAPEGASLVTRADFEEFKSEILSAISGLLGATDSGKAKSTEDPQEAEEYLDFGGTEDAKASREGGTHSQESNPKDTLAEAQEADPELPSGELRALATPAASASKPSMREATPASTTKSSVSGSDTARETFSETPNMVSGVDVLRALGEETPSPGIQDGDAEEVDADAMNAFSNLMSSAFSDWE